MAMLITGKDELVYLARTLERELAQMARERDAALRELGNMRLKDVAHKYQNAPIPKNAPENHSEPDNTAIGTNNGKTNSTSAPRTTDFNVRSSRS